MALGGPSAAMRSALWRWRRNSPVLGSMPWRTASNCSDIYVTREAGAAQRPALPLADNALAFGIIVTVFQVPG